ncbi:MAG TPA: hypothetical protein VKZ53_03140 [Candidatus Angelobacter sp.]|nr:hypothetical protein [Candidatus Angelobacter sp.]
MKKKALLMASLAAIVLSIGLLASPAQSIGSHCTSCSKIDPNNPTAVIVSACDIDPVDSCSCPLTGKLLSNNCLRLP